MAQFHCPQCDATNDIDISIDTDAEIGATDQPGLPFIGCSCGGVFMPADTEAVSELDGATFATLYTGAVCYGQQEALGDDYENWYDKFVSEAISA
ncbi:hypothetical protein NP511_04805 [Natrinema thermotolerans]|uniref:Uncharacterized protein n=1 Tax=Natrinema thermotolerans TaxID=121872 RepID=A0AAF0PCZ8_9EURY|nr:hypothetical protein [Natrinema thermotolerans]QCC57860.1 hypothetical protein DVR14_04090 [Natrinema thermotolerans]WMT08952.1 hypothetical protein NP511_04805 [Natrinema thermotolerans]